MDYKRIFENMVTRTQKYLEDNNLKAMVLGLSGGIDSTLSALVCHEISKRTNHKIKFIGISLPAGTNQVSENEIANGLGVLCDQYWVHFIEDEFLSIKNLFNYSTESVNIGYMNNLQLGNIKARIRMMYLYNIASMTGGVTIDTDNLSEHYLGFWTIHGDVFDIGFIGQLWKTDIYNLSKYLLDNFDFTGIEEAKNALRDSIDAVPTDGNGVKDGGDLAQIAPGLTYYDVDAILQNEVLMPGQEKISNRNKYYNLYGKELVDGVIDRYKRTSYKRKPLPQVIEIS